MSDKERIEQACIKRARIEQAIDDMRDDMLEEALCDYLIETNIVSHFIEWLTMWKRRPITLRRHKSKES